MEQQLHVCRAYSEEYECDLYGFADDNGNMVIPPRYWCAHEFSEGLAAVGFIDEDGEAIERLGFIDMNGDWAIAPQFSFVISCGFTEGLCAVNVDEYYNSNEESIDTNTKMGYIDKTGRIVIAQKYFDAGPFYKGVAPVCVEKEGMSENCGWGFIDRTGREIVPLEYDMPIDKPYHTADGLLHLERNGEDYWFNLSGKQVNLKQKQQKNNE